MELSEIKAGRDFVDVHALVGHKSTATTKTGKAYADITLKDGGTSLKCKKWSYNAEKYDEMLTPGKVVKVTGSAATFNGELQGTIDSLEPSDKAPGDFAQKTRFQVEVLYAKIMEVISGFEDPMLKYVASTLLTKYQEDFCKAPAATGVHHCWFGGLLEHTYSMVALASRITKYYHDQYGSKYFSRDRVLCGVILHDLGKIFEYNSSTPAFKRQPGGVLANHIVRVPILVYNIATEWYNEALDSGSLVEAEYPWGKFDRERDHLIHILASHHGTQEWGSPVTPSSMEAVLVHQIDKLDSGFMQVLMALEGEDGDIEGFTKKAAYGDRAIYLKP